MGCCCDESEAEEEEKGIGFLIIISHLWSTIKLCISNGWISVQVRQGVGVDWLFLPHDGSDHWPYDGLIQHLCSLSLE